MVLAGLAQPGFAMSITKGAALKGAGDTVWPMMSTILGMVAVRVPVLLMVLWWCQRHDQTGLGLLAAWIGIWVDLNFRGVFNWAVFRTGQWKHKRV
jgi:Na+-driven multidrug efflux pump